MLERQKWTLILNAASNSHLAHAKTYKLHYNSCDPGYKLSEQPNKYLFPFCSWVKTELFVLGTPSSACLKRRSLVRWSVWFLLVHGNPGLGPRPDNLLLMRNVHLNAGRELGRQCGRSATLVHIARAHWMAVRCRAGLTELCRAQHATWYG
jgi:hypothetical protein